MTLERDRCANTIWNENKRGYCFLHSGVPKGHPMTLVYRGMLNRCYNENTQDFEHWGGKGIRVCARWFYSFDAFVSDMGPCPPGSTLDRIDNNKDYGPDNCRWATWTEQANNRTNNISSKDMIDKIRTARHSGLSFRAIAKLLDLSYGVVYPHAKDITASPEA